MMTEKRTDGLVDSVNALTKIVAEQDKRITFLRKWRIEQIKTFAPIVDYYQDGKACVPIGTSIVRDALQKVKSYPVVEKEAVRQAEILREIYRVVMMEGKTYDAKYKVGRIKSILEENNENHE